MTMLKDLKQLAQDLRLALIDGDTTAALSYQNRLMGEVAAGLLQQDTEALLDLRAAVADLGPVADRYGDGKKGDRWRAVWELLHAISETSRPLEQMRLARPNQVAGQLLRLISAQPGITPGEMGTLTAKTDSHISNTLKTLMEQGLVHRIPKGRNGHYYLSAMGRELLGVAVPPALEISKTKGAELIDLDEERLRRRDKTNFREVPGRQLLSAGVRP